MVFCGQCGFQLASDNIRCPRCGAAIEVDVPGGDLHTDDPTIASPSYLAHNASQSGTQLSAGPLTPNNPQRLVLRPETNSYPQNTQQAQEATSRVDAQSYATYSPQPISSPGASYPGYPQSSSNYPPQGPAYTGFVPQGGMSYPPSQPGPVQTSQNASGRVVALVLILLGLLLILSAIVLFILQRNTTANNNTGNPPLTTNQQVQNFIQQYYDEINKHDYQTAYNQWQTYTDQNFAQFKAGFRQTKEDQITISNIAEQPDGMVTFTVPVKASELSPARLSFYQGFYIVAKQSDGTWKITHGHLDRRSSTHS